jgi:transcriptional regulator with XRE-family HTH domain
MPENVGLIIKNLCDEKGITNAELERTLDLANGSIARWIKGAAPNSTALEKVADYFKVSADYLLGRTIERATLEEWNKKYDAAKLSTETKAIETIAAHLDDVNLTDEEIDMLELYIKTLVKNKKNNK